MTLSVWRYAHLALAILSSLVLIVASLTGVILAIDAANERTQPYQVAPLDEVLLSEFLINLDQHYSDITRVTIDHNQFVILEAFDAEGNEIKAYIDPRTCSLLGSHQERSEFIQWTTALHRSLFLHETGRFIVGLVSFLFFLIVLSGSVLLVNRQKGIPRFFARINRDSWSQYLHVVSARLMLVPLVVIALTGTYLFMLRFELISNQEPDPIVIEILPEMEEISKANFSGFEGIYLAEVSKIEFPLFDDPEEFFVLKLKDKEVVIQQFTGQVISETKYPFTLFLESLSLDLHTGRTNVILALVLALASASVLLFIYTGFSIFLKRTRTRIKNKFSSSESDYILLVGSENGSTFGFANKIHLQLQAQGLKSYIGELNGFTKYPHAKHVLIFTSTHGQGDAPTNARRFGSLLAKNIQDHPIAFSVVGFGSRAYPKYCSFAEEIYTRIAEQDWAKSSLPIYTVNNRSLDEFARWVAAWSRANSIALATTPSYYELVQPKLFKFKLIDKKVVISDEVTTLILGIKPLDKPKFISGDLLAIHPDQTGIERLYSIGKVDDHIQLLVRMHPNGLGSGFLNRLEIGDKLAGRILNNPYFNFPIKSSKVALIANGTGIAPFWGMLDENRLKTETHLYCGFRQQNEMTKMNAEFCGNQIKLGKLKSFHVTFSRNEPFQYVMNLIERDHQFFVELLENQGHILICGSLALQTDVELVLQSITEKNGLDFKFYKSNGQILADCY